MLKALLLGVSDVLRVLNLVVVSSELCVPVELDVIDLLCVRDNVLGVCVISGL